MKHTLLALLLLIAQAISAQVFLGVFAGGATYLGELNNNPYKRTKVAAGLTISYEVSNRVSLRGGLTFGKLEGGDPYSGDNFQKQNRNLSFQSSLTEFNLLGELSIFNLNNINWSPYLFGGVAVYHFNPYIEDGGAKIYLQPLSTEGQGIAGAAGKEYQLTQFAVPFGGGLKFNLSENVRLGGEIGLRRLFTDYIDDVSTSYPDADALLSARGATAVQYSYRGDEVPGETSAYPDSGFPAKGINRGNPNKKDWYYFTGLHISFRLGGGGGSMFGGSGKKYGCPSVPL